MGILELAVLRSLQKTCHERSNSTAVLGKEKRSPRKNSSLSQTEKHRKQVFTPPDNSTTPEEPASSIDRPIVHIPDALAIPLSAGRTSRQINNAMQWTFPLVSIYQIRSID